MKRIGIFLTVALVALVACGGSEATDEPGGDGGDGGQGGQGGGETVDECPAAGATQCVGASVRTCTQGADGLRWGEPAECPGEQSCQQDSCQDPTAAQLAQADAAASYLQALVDKSAWHGPLDVEAIGQQARLAIVKGDGSDLTFKTALRGIHLAHPQGHQGLYDQSCGTDMPPQGYSRLGACGRPLGETIVVTWASPTNPLGLKAGDRVVGAGEDEGEAMLQAAARRPVCATSSPTEAHRFTAAAASFFGTAPQGMELTVERLDGTVDEMVVPAGGSLVSCQDPLGRDIDFNADAYLRDDGVGVVRLPRFFPLDYQLPPNPTQADYDALIDHMRQAVLAAFDEVAAAPAIIWDARSNYGGITPVGLEIVGGMPSAQAKAISSCRARIEGTDPPQFTSATYAEYAIAPGGPFAYTGKVAVLIDGLDYSAADYFPYAITQAAPDTLLVGTPTAGAYGGAGPQLTIDGPPLLTATYDLNRCEDASGLPLEGHSVQPDLLVEYDPADLAAGVDTVMETAATALLADR